MTQTVAAAFQDAAARWPERPFLNVLSETANAYGIEPGVRTYGCVAAAVERRARDLRAAGIGLSTRVLVLLENRPEAVETFLALNTCGASFVPINPDLRHTELR
ncbi:MAG: AMP-binding protein, partial [Pseudomonadota bacterium]